MDPENMRCASCADVGGDLATQVRQVSCEPCSSNIAAGADERDCIGMGTCECAGGPPELASICPAEGYWLYTDHEKLTDLKQNQAKSRSRSQANRALNEAFKLFECYPQRSGETGSRCRHWSECAEEGTERCDSKQPNCCAKGFTGHLCEFCDGDMVRVYGAQCVECVGNDWPYLILAFIMVFFLVCYIMTQTVQRFEEATARFTIAVFFLQTVGLLLRGRFPNLSALTEIFDFNFMKPAAKCIIDGQFYHQWVFGIFSTPVSMLIYYMLIVAFTMVTSQAHSVRPMVKLGKAKLRYNMVLFNTLSRSEFFSVLKPKERHKIASSMDHRVVQEGENIVEQGDLGHEFFVIVDGECVPKVDGLRVGLDNLKSGDSFGENSLLHSAPRQSTVTAVSRTLVGVLTKKRLGKLMESMADAAQLKDALRKLEADSGGKMLDDRRGSDPDTVPSTPERPEAKKHKKKKHGKKKGKGRKKEEKKLMEVEMTDIMPLEELEEGEEHDEEEAEAVEQQQPQEQDGQGVQEGEGLGDTLAEPTPTPAADGKADLADMAEEEEGFDANAWFKLPLLQSGNLSKKGFDHGGLFKTRWFELRGSYLVYFVDSEKGIENGNLKGSINLNEVEDMDGSELEAQNELEITMRDDAVDNPGRTFRLRASNHDERDVWMAALSTAHAHTLSQLSAGRGKYSKRLTRSSTVARTNQDRLQAKEIKMSAERAMLFSYRTIHSEKLDQKQLKSEALHGRKIIGKIMPLADALRKVGLEIKTFYEACLDPVARKCAVLEIGIVLYGPVMKDALVLLFCEEDAIDPDKSVLSADSTIECYTNEHMMYMYVAVFMLLLFMVGVPLFMIGAAWSVDSNLNYKHHMEEAEQMAKARYVASWKILPRHVKKDEIESCLHEILSVQMSAHCFLLSKFQMSCRRETAHWYPLWYMFRRAIITVAFMDGLGNTSQLAGNTGLPGFNLGA
jgi:CRP-like cAMP-binding protein